MRRKLYLYTFNLVQQRSSLCRSKHMNRPKLAMPIYSLWLDFPFYKQTTSVMGRPSGFQSIFSTGFLILEWQNSPTVYQMTPLAAAGHSVGLVSYSTVQFI